MEVFAPILWIVIVAVALVAKSSSKVRKTLEKAARSMETQGNGEAWPTWDTAPQPADPQPAPPTFPDPAGPQFPADPGSVGGENSLFGPVIRKTKAARKQLRTTAAPSPAQSAPERQQLRPTVTQPAAKPVDEERSGLAEEFDLRRAIIYSEILKPKFDE